eukprot:9187039-Pyramimonas_sp.AAC.1
MHCRHLYVALEWNDGLLVLHQFQASGDILRKYHTAYCPRISTQWGWRRARRTARCPAELDSHVNAGSMVTHGVLPCHLVRRCESTLLDARTTLPGARSTLIHDSRR